MEEEISARRVEPGDLIIPFSIALAQLAIQMLFNGNYGYFRDELDHIAGSKHLAFGYVDQPPLSIAILAVVRWTIGDSLHAIRFLPALAISATAILAALMTHHIGGGRFATSLASLCVVAAPVLLGQGRYFSMNSLDIFFWAAASYLVIRILTGDSPKLWLLFAIVTGLGLLNKYSIGFFCVGLAAGILLTQHRSQLASKWFWLGVLVASLLFLPHVLWEFKNGFPSLEFMRNASQQKNAPISVLEFTLSQFLELNYFSAPIWLLGLAYFFLDRHGRTLRVFWMGVRFRFRDHGRRQRKGILPLTGIPGALRGRRSFSGTTHSRTILELDQTGRRRHHLVWGTHHGAFCHSDTSHKDIHCLRRVPRCEAEV